MMSNLTFVITYTVCIYHIKFIMFIYIYPCIYIYIYIYIDFIDMYLYINLQNLSTPATYPS